MLDLFKGYKGDALQILKDFKSRVWSDAIVETNNGTFKGIIIADDIIHVHTNIYGAVVGLSSSPSDGNCIGNGNGSILYSKDAVDQAVSTVNSCSTSKNYGFGKTRMNVIGWYDQL